MSVQQLESRISAEASDLLDCFSEELADAVYGLAEDYARARITDPNQPVEISPADIRQAGEALLGYLRGAVERGELPPHWAAAISGMTDCMASRGR
jgi:hypothetical protein